VDWCPHVYDDCMLQLTSIAKEIGPSVVRLGRGSRRGSGVVVARDRVVTLSRSVPAARELEVWLGDTLETGEVLGSDRSTGLSLLRVATGGARPLQWTDA